MGVARKIEKHLEKMVDGLSSAIFRGSMTREELAGRLLREADLLVADGTDGPTIPNRYRIRANPRDIEQAATDGSLERELAAAITLVASERGWELPGRVRVAIVPDPDVAAGSITCEAEVVAGRRPVWGQLLDVSAGTAYEVTGNRVSIGRSHSADISLPQPEVSRTHAMLYRRGGSVWLTDLGSSNGTRLNGQPVGGDPVVVHPGDQLQFGTATLALRLLA